MNGMLGILIAIIAGALLVIILMAITGMAKKRKQGESSGLSKHKNKSKSVIVKECNKKLLKDPNNITALTLLSDLYFEEKNFEKAVAFYNHLCNLTRAHPQIDKKKVFLNHGISSYKCGKLDDAGRSLVTVLKEDPKDFSANLYIGRVFFEKKDFEKALTCLKRAYIVNQNDTDVIEYLGKTLYELKRYREAATLLKKILDINPENKEFVFLYASCCEETNYLEKALKLFSHLRLDPEYGSQACLACATIHEKQNQPTKAIQDYEIALKNEGMPKETKLPVLYKLANNYIQMHNIPKGLNYLRQIQMISSGYKDVDMLVRRYQELNQNVNLQTYLLSSVNDFTLLCRKFVMNFFSDAKVKIEETKVNSEGLEITAQVFSDKWENIEMFKFFRSTGAVGDLYVRDFHSKMRDIKCERGYCITAGTFTEEAKKYVEGRPIDLLDKPKLIVALKRIEK